LTRLIAIFLAFIVGVCAAWLWLLESKEPNLENITVIETPAITPLVKAAPQQFQFEPEPQFEPKPKQLKFIPVNRHENFQDVVIRLEQLAAFTGKRCADIYIQSQV